MCKFGCDSLFEEGYILVDNNGIIIKNKLNNDNTLNKKELILINNLINKKVLNFNERNKKYYNFHFQYHSQK
ncbi:hypothetical protein [Spiroplasma endosymbiont of Glossina fuscipes fuscipes]|uniref:hypothetical protein n=1 Tax=Spiroplasma endosymbiont of Glossina fuscipes fuscipes TaxID=2004463 RepID=UPI003C74E620